MACSEGSRAGGSLEAGLASLVAQMPWADVQVKGDPLESRAESVISDNVSDQCSVQKLDALGGIMPMPRPAGIPRPGPIGSCE